MEARRKALWIDQTPPEELEISDNIKKKQNYLEAVETIMRMKII